MKKLIILVGLVMTLALPASVKAADLYGFMDGKFYDSNAVLKYICFMDGNCYDTDLKPAPFKITPVTPVEAPTTAPVVTTPTSNSPTNQTPTTDTTPVDTTAPKIKLYSYTDCYSSCRGVVVGDASVEERNMVQLRQGFFNVITDEATTIKVTLVPITNNQGETLFPGMNRDQINAAVRSSVSHYNPIYFEDNTSTTIHAVTDANMGTQSNVQYVFKIEARDAAGNTGTQNFGGDTLLQK